VGVGSITVDIINADTGTADSLKLCSCGNDFWGDLGLGSDDEGIVFSDDGDEFFR